MPCAIEKCFAAAWVKDMKEYALDIQFITSSPARNELEHLHWFIRSIGEYSRDINMFAWINSLPRSTVHWIVPFAVMYTFCAESFTVMHLKIEIALPGAVTFDDLLDGSVGGEQNVTNICIYTRLPAFQRHLLTADLWSITTSDDRNFAGCGKMHPS